jgi:exo-beta-1,3-glucanase (GH17 family)/cellulose synthase/poly-beta-1,6-N-acetylglucosamine synthase-like glycosyltransferase
LRTLHRPSEITVSAHALALALGAALLNLALWAWAFAPIAAPDVLSPVAGLSYTPFQRADDPTRAIYPSATTIDQDLALVAQQTKRIRTYSSSEFPGLISAAQGHGLEVTAGVWLSKDLSKNEAEVAAGIQAAQSNPQVKALIVGNETVLKRQLSAAQLSLYLDKVRQATRTPVSSAEPWNIWLANPQLAHSVDFITIHLLPYWEGIAIENAVGHALYQYDAVRKRFPNKPVLIGEVGWPSNGDQLGAARATPANQAKFVREFLAAAQPRGLNYFLMEANDQPWKMHEEGHAGAYWGLSDAYRVPKFRFQGPIEIDPYWTLKAGASSLLGFALLFMLLRKLSGLRFVGRLYFALAAQAIVAVAVFLCTQPLTAYMRTTDWLALLIFVPTLAAMLVILLAHAFEFAELFWEGSLSRSFVAKPLPIAAKQPLVSIHLACSNEPPEMVIATLKSLHRLRYSNFEVLVVDNNTREERLWQPVRDFVASLPAHFQFFHLPECKGFKAGALNFALTKTANEAVIVAVVDADYVVNPDWLNNLVSYFEDASVGIVQAPQAHRDWAHQTFRTMMNWEYDGFFRIGMHHRNERNAIIQHGTMTMIRASALREHGAWQEWCVCEDAELGLRLMRAGFNTVYVDQVAGHGLTPDGFLAFKKQRYRWAQGGMQILKAHGQALLGRSASALGLSSGQRYHFLAGWLPWLGDALHLVFALMAVVWTLAAVAFPRWITLPTTLFMLPLIAFVMVKLVIGPLLYWRRVPCSAREIFGASVAGMGLSHAIARGVFAGLFGAHATFVVTAKGEGSPKSALRMDWRTVSEEIAVLLALLGAATVIGAWSYLNAGPSLPDKSSEVALWISMLLLQALPYAAAIWCVKLSSLPARTAVKVEVST